MEINLDNPFEQFEPQSWEPHSEIAQKKWGDQDPYIVHRTHGVMGKVVLHNSNDQINNETTFLDTVLVEYKIGKQSYPIFRVRDFFEVGYPIAEEGHGNLTGDLAERIARRVTKYFLKHITKEGDTGGIFDERFNPQDKNGYIVTNNDEYVLKIQKYPNMVLLRRKGGSDWSYDVVKELDGFFDFRCNGKRHILVLESKLDKIQLSSEKLVTNLFDPLKELFPDVQLHYILFSSPQALFYDVHKRKILKTKAYEIFHILRYNGVGSLFLEFHEKTEEFNTAANHLIQQYNMIALRRVKFTGTIILDRNRLSLYDRGESPFMELEKTDKQYLWREIE